MTLSTLKSFFLKYDIWFIFALVFMNFAHNVKFDFLLLIDTLISYIDGFDDGSFTRTDLSGFSLIMLILSIIPISLITPVFEEYITRSWLKTKLSKNLPLAFFLLYIFFFSFISFLAVSRTRIRLDFLKDLAGLIGGSPALMLFLFPFTLALALVLNKFSVGVYLEKIKSKTPVWTLFVSNWIIFFLFHSQFWFEGDSWYIFTFFFAICAIFPYVVLRYGVRLSILIHILLNFLSKFSFTPSLNGSQVFLYYFFYTAVTASLLMVIGLESTRLKKLETKV